MGPLLVQTQIYTQPIVFQPYTYTNSGNWDVLGDILSTNQFFGEIGNVALTLINMVVDVGLIPTFFMIWLAFVALSWLYNFVTGHPDRGVFVDASEAVDGYVTDTINDIGDQRIERHREGGDVQAAIEADLGRQERLQEYRNYRKNSPSVNLGGIVVKPGRRRR